MQNRLFISLAVIWYSPAYFIQNKHKPYWQLLKTNKRPSSQSWKYLLQGNWSVAWQKTSLKKAPRFVRCKFLKKQPFVVEENHLAPTPTNYTDPHSLRRTRFTLVLRKAIFPPAMVLGTYTAKSTRLRGSSNLYLPVYHIQIPRAMPLIVILLKTVTTPTTFRKHRNSDRTFRRYTTMYRASHRLT